MAPDPRRWGVEPGYHDVTGHWRAAPQSSIDLFLATVGAHDGDPPPGPAVVAAPGRPHPQVSRGQIHLEDGGTMAVDGPLPFDLPFGYHRHVGTEGASSPIIVSPGRCWLPAGLKTWGWAAQLYATRSRSSWGMGDLADLRRLGRWSAAQGAGVALINPLHAALPIEDQQPSPYFASSRCYRNPLYLRIEEVPGAERLATLPALAAAGRALNDNRRIDRNAVWKLKSEALEALFATSGADPELDRYLAEQGDGLRSYATFCALTELHGVPWEKWPDELRRPGGAGIAPFAASEAGARRIRYHSWLQWLLDGQLSAASQTIGLVQDLAIGADAGGADAWRWQDVTALGVRVGAPPDEFNVDGQNWALPPFDPWKLRSAGYRPFIELLRNGLRYAGGLRFDHVMGLFRLFWIPDGASPSEGTYVRYPYGDLLDILALESHRARAFVVGEDLGTVEDIVRTELLARGVLSYRLLWFEATHPGSGEWPEQALAAASTHDLPTVAGVWSGADLAVRQSLGLNSNEQAERALRARIAEWAEAHDAVPPDEVVTRVYRLLAQAPSAVITASLDDAVLVEERPNMPGTTTEWPNWQLGLPEPLEEIETSPLADAIARALNGRGGSPSGST